MAKYEKISEERKKLIKEFIINDKIGMYKKWNLRMYKIIQK